MDLFAKSELSVLVWSSLQIRLQVRVECLANNLLAGFVERATAPAAAGALSHPRRGTGACGLFKNPTGDHDIPGRTRNGVECLDPPEHVEASR